MEQRFAASIEAEFGLLTDPKWFEARSLASVELSVSVKANKSAGSVRLTKKRRVRRDPPALEAKVMSPETIWTSKKPGCACGYES